MRTYEYKGRYVQIGIRMDEAESQTHETYPSNIYIVTDNRYVRYLNKLDTTWDISVTADDQEGLRPVRYGDKVERIYRVVLSRRLDGPTWYRVAKEADVAYGWAHRVLKGLERDGILEGREVTDPGALFALWASRPDKRVYREYHVQDASSVINGADMDYALTGYSAETLIVQYLFPRYNALYVHEGDGASWHDLMTSQGLVGRGNVQVILADEHVFFERQEVEGWPLVSLQQVIVDLYRTGVECAEAADLLVGRLY